MAKSINAELLIPVTKLTARRGVFRWPDKPVLACVREADLLPLGMLADDLAALGLVARIDRNAFGPAAVRIRRATAPTAPESYRMTLAAKGIDIVAADDAGAYYAVATLRELLVARGRRMPACDIDDRPDFARRGVYHDCSRGKVPKLGSLKGLVEQLARWKINELQLYVENVFTFVRHPAIGQGYNPFTPEELLQLQDHCKQHHVRLVGSLASLGHMEKILQLPAYRRLGELPGKGGRPGGTTLDPGNPNSLKLITEMYEEFVPLFEADDFNVCGDEPWELGQGKSKQRAARIGVGGVYCQWLGKLHALCDRHGKRMNVWSDIVLDHPEMLPDLPGDIAMLNWDYHPKGKRIPRSKEITDAGLALVVCPGTNAWGSHGCRLEMGVKNIAAFAAEGIRRGAEGLLNTDWGDGGHRNMLAVSLHNFAFGAAHAWNHRAAKAAGFTQRFCRHTFGKTSGRLAKAIETLGSAHATLGLPYDRGTPLYSVLLGPTEHFLAAEGRAAGQLAKISPKAFIAHARALTALRWPAAEEAPNAFLADSLGEYALATRLDAVACRRGAILRTLRDGHTPDPADVTATGDAMSRLGRELSRIWRRRNKRSRLKFILRDLRLATTELRKLT